MADYGRNAGQILEVATGPDDDRGRIGGTILEVAVGPDDDRARYGGAMLEVAIHTNEARVAALFCEVFMVPRDLDIVEAASPGGQFKARIQRGISTLK